jgi:hypothetical protein
MNRPKTRISFDLIKPAARSFWELDSDGHNSTLISPKSHNLMKIALH